jgi:hypothetical protein
MVAKGNKDSHRMTYSGGVKAVELEKWGRNTARERYGALDYENRPPPAAKNLSAPQRLGDSNNLRGPSNDVSPNSWLRGGGERGYPPNFDRGSKRR